MMIHYRINCPKIDLVNRTSFEAAMYSNSGMKNEPVLIILLSVIRHPAENVACSTSCLCNSRFPSTSRTWKKVMTHLVVPSMRSQK